MPATAHHRLHQISLTGLPDDLLKKIDALAQRNLRSRANQIVFLLAEIVRKAEKARDSRPEVK